MALYVLSGKMAIILFFNFRVAYTSRCTSASSGVSWDCASILLTSGVLTLIDAEYSASALSDGFMSPRPPTRTGNATRSRSASEQLLNMSGGISTSEIARSKVKAAVGSRYPVVFS